MVEIETLENVAAARVRERDVAKPNFPGRRPGAPITSVKPARIGHCGSQAQDGRDRRSGAVERPAEPAERNHRSPYRALCEYDGFP